MNVAVGSVSKGCSALINLRYFRTMVKVCLGDVLLKGELSAKDFSTQHPTALPFYQSAIKDTGVLAVNGANFSS